MGKMEKAPKPTNEKPTNPLPKLHPWRLCPMGEHWVREHPRRVKPTKKHPFERTTSVAGHCRDNPSRKDQLYSDEIEEIADYRFGNLKGGPCPDNLGFKNAGSKYDPLVRGWTKYWNDVLKPRPPLDPNLVKALIASESSFNPKKDNGKKGDKRATGLMQLTNETLKILSDEKGELKDHLINIDQEDITDPNLNICAGIRWLFQKRRLASGKLGRQATWEEAIAEYKSYLSAYRKNPDHRGMGNFRKYYESLKKCK